MIKIPSQQSLQAAAHRTLTHLKDKCNQNRESTKLTPQEITIITLLAIGSKSEIKTESIEIVNDYIRALTKRVKAEIASGVKSSSNQKQEQLAQELYLLSTLPTQNNSKSGGLVESDVKKKLLMLCDSFNHLYDSVLDLQAIYTTDSNQAQTTERSHSLLSEYISSPSVYSIGGFSQIQIPYYLMRAWHPVPVNRFRNNPKRPWKPYLEALRNGYERRTGQSFTNNAQRKIDQVRSK